MAMGNTGVTGRDDDVVFYNPAQLVGVRGGFNVSLATYGRQSKLGAMSGSFAGGPLSLGWGVQVVNFTIPAAEPYPFAAPVLTREGNANAQSTEAVVGAAMLFKGFRIGAAAKYTEDRVDAAGNLTAPGRDVHSTVAADVGVAHALWQGVAGLSLQNLGRDSGRPGRRIDIPVQAALGWTRTEQVGMFDLGLATQVTARPHWFSPAVGAEFGYSWIEGYTVTARAGARRPDASGERPVTLGAGFTGDRLTLDYALQFFDSGRNAHRITIRWR